MTSTGSTSIPTELCINFFSFLDYKDLCTCGVVSRQWNEAFNNNYVLWVYLAATHGFDMSHEVEKSNAKKRFAFCKLKQRLSLVNNFVSLIDGFPFSRAELNSIKLAAQDCRSVVAIVASIGFTIPDFMRGQSWITTDKRTEVRKGFVKLKMTVERLMRLADA